MRTIKFRGNRLDNGEWVFGDLLRMHGVPYIYPDPAPNGWNDYEVIPDTVGQFTGLHDCDGNPIYEGDILSNLSPEEFSTKTGYPIEYSKEEIKALRYAVVYEDYGFVFISKTDKHCWLNPEFHRVIGNIHDNPELMNNH